MNAKYTAEHVVCIIMNPGQALARKEKPDTEIQGCSTNTLLKLETFCHVSPTVHAAINYLTQYADIKLQHDTKLRKWLSSC